MELALVGIPPHKANFVILSVVFSPMRAHFAIVAICFTANILCYVDRTNISTAIIPMAEQYKWNKVEQGEVLAAFFIGYISTQILGGWMAAKHGGCAVLVAAVVIWSAFTVLTPWTAPYFKVLLACRVGLGIGEGVPHGAMHTARPVPHVTRVT